ISASPSPVFRSNNSNNNNQSSNSHPAWSLQAQLWQNELTPTTPYKHHHTYDAKQLSSHSQQQHASSITPVSQNQERTPSRTLVEANNHHHLNISQTENVDNNHNKSKIIGEDRANVS